MLKFNLRNNIDDNFANLRESFDEDDEEGGEASSSRSQSPRAKIQKVDKDYYSCYVWSYLHRISGKKLGQWKRTLKNLPKLKVGQKFKFK